MLLFKFLFSIESTKQEEMGGNLQSKHFGQYTVGKKNCLS